MDPPLSTAGPGLPPEQIQAGPNIPIRAVGCSTGQMIGKCFCRSVALQGHQIWVATTEHPKGRPAGTMQHLHPRLMLKPSSMTQQMQHRQRLGGEEGGVCEAAGSHHVSPLFILHGYFLISHSRKEKDLQQPPAHPCSQLQALISTTPGGEVHHHHRHHHSPMGAQVSLLHAIPHPARTERETPRSRLHQAGVPVSMSPGDSPVPKDACASVLPSPCPREEL